MESVILRLVYLFVIGHEQPHDLPRQLHWIYPQLSKFGRERCRMHNPSRQRSQGSGVPEMIRDHDSVERFGGMRGPPTHYDRAMAHLIQDVPDRLGSA